MWIYIPAIIYGTYWKKLGPSKKYTYIAIRHNLRSFFGQAKGPIQIGPTIWICMADKHTWIHTDFELYIRERYRFSTPRISYTNCSVLDILLFVRDTLLIISVVATFLMLQKHYWEIFFKELFFVIADGENCKLLLPGKLKYCVNIQEGN